MKDLKAIFARRPCLSLPEIEAYLRGECSSEQRYALENHLLDCPLCSAAVEGLAEAGHPANLTSAVAGLQAPLPPRSGRVISLSARAWINRAAAVALLTLMAYAGYRYWGATANDRLFAQHFQLAENPYPLLRSGEPALADQPELQAAMTDYLAGEFDRSLPHFNNFLAQHGPDPQASLLAANACLEAGRGAQARDYLLPLLADDAQLHGQPKWYLALAYLKLGQLDATRQVLLAILDDEYSPFRQEAAALLEKL